MTTVFTVGISFQGWPGGCRGVLQEWLHAPELPERGGRFLTAFSSSFTFTFSFS